MQNYKTILKHPKIMGWDFLAFMPKRQQNGCTIRKTKAEGYNADGFIT